MDNPSKRLLSGKFASELDSAFSKRGEKSNVEEKFNGIKHNNFQLAKVDFERFLSSDRFPAALANFKKMGMLIKTPEQHEIFQRCFTTLLLSGQLQTHADKGLRKRMLNIARTYGFVPGMVVKDFDHPEKVFHLLKKASKGSFDSAVSYKASDFSAGSHSIDIKRLSKDIEKRRNTEDNYSTLTSFFKNDLVTTDWKAQNDAIMQDFKDKMMENSPELTDNDLIQNPEFANQGGLSSSKAVMDIMLEYSNGKFKGDDPEKVAAKQSYRKMLTNDIKKIDTSNQTALKFVLNQFLTMFSERGFGEADKEDIVTRLKTAQFYKKQIEHHHGSPITAEIQIGQEIVTTGTVSSDDRKDLIKFAIKGNVLNAGNGNPPTEFNQALEAFYQIFESQIDQIVTDDIITDTF